MRQFLQLVLAVSPANDISRQIANAHTTFNVVNTLLFLPLASLPFTSCRADTYKSSRHAADTKTDHTEDKNK